MRVLIVEDETELRTQLSRKLRAVGYTVDVAEDGRIGAHIGQDYPIDIAIVDLGLPDTGPSGLELIQRWRAAGKTFRILVLTARDSWQHVVEGLEAGADDYMTKPFAMEELLARVRVQERNIGAKRWTDNTLRSGPVMLDMRSQRVTVDGAPVELTTMQYRLLKALLLRLGEVLSQRELIEQLYEDDEQPLSNVVPVQVRQLRQKLDPEGVMNPIETVAGRGYRFRALDP